MRALIAAALVAGCWTGSSPAQTPIAAPAEHHASEPALRVRLEQKKGFGEYTIEIDARRHVATFEGVSMVQVVGARSARLSDIEIANIDQAIDSVHFFERNERGSLPVQPACTSDGTTTTCTLSTSISVCSHGDSVIIMVQRGGISHRIQKEICAGDNDLHELIDAVEHVARRERWIFK